MAKQNSDIGSAIDLNSESIIVDKKNENNNI